MGRAWKVFVLGLAGVAATATLTGAALALAGSGLSSPANAVQVSARLLVPRESTRSRPASRHATRTETRTSGAASPRASIALDPPSGSTVAAGDARSGDASAIETGGPHGSKEGDRSEDERHREEHPHKDEDHGDD
jgi:hypothetical protein